jgi:hypothetical protein
LRRRPEHLKRTGWGRHIYAGGAGVDQGRGVDRHDLCLDGLGKKNACDEKKQGKNASLQNDLLG